MRDNNYYREMRKKHIERKKRISNSYHYPLELKFDGMYSKGKIHCSCSMCASKTNNKHLKTRGPVTNWKHSDAILIDAMNADLKEFEYAL